MFHIPHKIWLNLTNVNTGKTVGVYLISKVVPYLKVPGMEAASRFWTQLSFFTHWAEMFTTARVNFLQIRLNILSECKTSMKDKTFAI